MNNNMYIPYIDRIYFTKKFPTPIAYGGNEKPPTLYSILNSIVNFGKEDKEKIVNLAKEGRKKIFDFDYELDESITKEEFETTILNHFLMRRIGFETVTAFKIQLNVKLHEIMPMYNKMFNLYAKALTFGNVTVKEGKTKRNIEKNANEKNNINVNVEDVSDLRYSDTPQNKLSDVQNGNYITDYNYNTNKNKSDSDSERNLNDNTKDDNEYQETTTNLNLIDDMLKLNESLNTVYSLIFKDLECLFYGLI